MLDTARSGQSQRVEASRAGRRQARFFFMILIPILMIQQHP